MLRDAKAIWLKESKINQYVEAKKSFVLTEIEAAKLQICADAEYAVFLNEQYVGSGQYRTLSNRKVYDEYDVTPFLQKGENELRVIAYSQGVDSSTYRSDLPMMSFAFQCGDSIIILSGEDTQVREHPHYKSGEMEKVSNQLGFSYHYYANNHDTEWQKASVVKRDYNYEKRPIKQLVHGDILQGTVCAQGFLKRISFGTPAEQMQTDGLFWKSKEEVINGNVIIKQSNGDGVFFVVDLGQEFAGILQFELEAASGTVLDISWGEHVDDLRVRSHVGDRNFACRYVCSEGKQKFTGYFRRVAGRYLQVHITNMSDNVTIHQLGLVPTDYPLAREGYFKCNDYFINHLVKVATHTLKLCMHEHYEDCPWREQALYAFDSYIQMLCGYYLFGEYEFAKASLQLLADTQREDGLLTLCAPAEGNLTIPSFSLSWIMSLEQYVLYSGDIDFGRKMLGVAENILKKAFVVKAGLVYAPCGEGIWNFYEWASGLDGENSESVCENKESILSCLYILALQAYNRILDYTHQIAPIELQYDIQEMRTAVKQEFWNPEKRLMRTRRSEDVYHEYTQALAILSGVITEEFEYEKLLQKDNGMVKMTLSTSIFKYEALLTRGPQFYDAVLDEIAEKWGAMLYSGASTLWEVAEGAAAFDNAGSLCHGWSAVPVYLIYKYYLGYEPISPGFEQYRLKPQKTRHITGVETILFQQDKAMVYSDNQEKI